MRVRTIGAALEATRGEGSPRPVPRLKKGGLTSLCAGASLSYNYGRLPSGPYQFSGECYCLSPEHHGLQFQDGGPEEPDRGHC
jgi:hypothetical protein